MRVFGIDLENTKISGAEEMWRKAPAWTDMIHDEADKPPLELAESQDWKPHRVYRAATKMDPLMHQVDRCSGCTHSHQETVRHEEADATLRSSCESMLVSHVKV